MVLRVLIAPDSLKGTATAAEAAAAIASGWRAIRPEDEIECRPMADGGEGTLSAFEASVPGAVRRWTQVSGPLEDDVLASWIELPDGAAVIELAESSGITLLDPLSPMETHTYGFGQVIDHALDQGAERLVLAIGGSASTDGGAGMLTALGARLLDDSGEQIARGGTGLADIASCDMSHMRPLPRGGAVVLSDVVNPLFGRRGAAAVFGPQKGASPDQAQTLDRNLRRFARVMARSGDAPGAGAAGGAGYGLLVWGAQMSSGADGVASALELSAEIARADVVITGEGRFDHQTAGGKVASYVAQLAPDRTFLIAGRIEAPTRPAFQDAVALDDLAGSSESAMLHTLRYLSDAGSALASRVALPRATRDERKEDEGTRP